ncbi:MAG: DUF4203 domain-containing protein, partial [Thermomicrobiales bacterium]
MQILIGLIIGVIGLAVCFFGLRFWFILLPVFGAIIGFFVGARVMQDLFGTGFLATTTSWIVGIIVGLAFALLSWFVWYAGAIIMAGAVGASLFSGILHALFTNPWGAVLFIVALIGAVIFAVGALVLNLPVYIVIVNSALGGASLAIAGLLTLLGNITTVELANGSMVAVVDEARFQGAGWLWVLLWIILAVAGIWYQLRSVAEVRLPEEKWVQARMA